MYRGFEVWYIVVNSLLLIPLYIEVLKYGSLLLIHCLLLIPLCIEVLKYGTLLLIHCC